MHMKRRTFFKAAAGSIPLLGLFPASLEGIIRDIKPGLIEKRSLGKTGEKLSVIGFGGIVVADSTTAEASERVSMAIDYGVNYFDVAPTYGNAEIMLGPALGTLPEGCFPGLQDHGKEKGRIPKGT